MDAAVMPVTSHSTCVYSGTSFLFGRSFEYIVGPALCMAIPSLHVAGDISWLTPSRSQSLSESNPKSGLTLAAGYDQLLQASGWQPCLLRKPFQKLSR